MPTMQAGRFERWAQARKRVQTIRAHLASGGRVVVATYTRATVYDRRHVDSFKADRNGCYVARGRSWDCIDFTPVRFVD